MKPIKNNRGGYSIAINNRQVGNYATKQAVEAVIKLNQCVHGSVLKTITEGKWNE